MRQAHVAILSAVVGVAFAVMYAIDGHALPGVVGGVLAAIVLYMAIGRFQEQHAANRARRERGRD